MKRTDKEAFVEQFRSRVEKAPVFYLDMSDANAATSAVTDLVPLMHR